MAGLSILSSLAIPNVNRFLDFNNIDEVKALLNSTAADCLQSSRFNPEGEAQQIDSNILSDSKLASIGYKINTSAKDCSYLEILPTDSDDTLRFPIGFSITRGKVTKFATPTSGDKGSINSCEGWAGGNCKQNEELKALVNYNKQISDAKQKCENSYSDWLKSDGNGPVNRWNPSADSKCPSRPPKVVNSTCTTNGCNRVVYALDGAVVGTTKEEYDKALTSKYGRICAEKVEALRRQSPPFTNPNNEAVTFEECGEQEFWFFKGEEVRDKTALEDSQCKAEQTKHEKSETTGEITIPECGNRTFYYCRGVNKQTANLMKQCIDEDQIAGCGNQITEKVASNFNGKFVAQMNGPGICSTVTWMCSGNKYQSQAAYDENCVKDCGAPPRDYCKEEKFYGNVDRCLVWQRCEGLIP